ncbi:MAG: EamA family transporter [Oligoflexia bacterium]|nr:EamA family transporter [Oligoflexia bacterium]
MTHTHRTAFFLLLCTAFLWSLGGVLIKLIPLHPLAIAGSRSVVAALVIWAFLRRPKFTWHWTQWGAAFCYVGTVILFVSATKLGPAANAIVLQYTAPVYVALMSHWFLGERITKADWISIVIALAGMGLFFVDKLDASSLLATLVAIASGVAFAGFTLFMKKGHETSTSESVLLGNALTALVCIPFAVSGFAQLPSPLLGQSVALILLMGTVQLAIPYIMFSVAIRRVTALEGSLIPMLEPILNPVWVLLFTGEMPSLWAFVGGAFIILAVFIRKILRF